MRNTRACDHLRCSLRQHGFPPSARIAAALPSPRPPTIKEACGERTLQRVERHIGAALRRESICHLRDPSLRTLRRRSVQGERDVGGGRSFAVRTAPHDATRAQRARALAPPWLVKPIQERYDDNGKRGVHRGGEGTRTAVADERGAPGKERCVRRFTLQMQPPPDDERGEPQLRRGGLVGPPCYENAAMAALEDDADAALDERRCLGTARENHAPERNAHRPRRVAVATFTIQEGLERRIESAL